jgi:hypothetical protein
MAPPAPTCPRCGYDQSGVIASWAASCPLAGTCSECGLPFTWRDVLSERYRNEARLFENADLNLARSFRITLLRSLAPWRLWRWIRMENPIKRWRLVLFTALAVPIVHAAAGLTPLVTALLGVLPPRYWGSGWVWMPRDTPLAALRFAAWPFTDNSVRDAWSPVWSTVHPLALAALLTFVLMPLSFLLLPVSLRRAKVRRAHLVRIAVYALPLWILLCDLPVLSMACIEIAGEASTELGWRWDRSAALDFIATNRWRYLLAATVLLLALWWWQAAKHYLKLPHTLLVALLMAALSAALATVAILLTPGAAAWFYWGL